MDGRAESQSTNCLTSPNAEPWLPPGWRCTNPVLRPIAAVILWMRQVSSSRFWMRGLVRCPRIQNLLEETCRIHKITAAIGRKTGFVQRHPGGSHGSAFGDVKQFVDCDSARPSIDRQPVEFARMDAIAGKAARFLADDDFGAVFLVGAFKPARDIYGITDHRVIEPEFRSDIADQHVAGINADTHPERPPAVVFQSRRPQGALAGERRPAGVDSVIGVSRGRAPERHHRIADELIDRAAMAADLT